MEMKKNYINIEGKEIKLSKETMEEFKKALCIEQEILVPECIKIGICDRNGLGIVFNDKKQVLFWAEEVYHVGRTNGPMQIPCKLTPCKREDLKAGDTAYSNIHGDPKFECLSNYCKILDETMHVYITNDTGIYPSRREYNYWWKVEKV